MTCVKASCHRIQRDADGIFREIRGTRSYPPKHASFTERRLAFEYAEQLGDEASKQRRQLRNMEKRRKEHNPIITIARLAALCRRSDRFQLEYALQVGERHISAIQGCSNYCKLADDEV